MRSIVSVLVVLILAVLFPREARAETVQLAAHACHAVSRAGPDDVAAVRRLPFACGDRDARGYQDRWIWLRYDADRLATLPARWQLMVDQARFARIAVIAAPGRGAAQVIVRDAGGLGRNWTLGNLMRFAIDRPGAELDHVYVGFEKLDELTLMRKVTASTADSAGRTTAQWLALMGLFAGALLSAFAYNLLIYTGHRQAFQRWYLLWVATGLAYGLTWTNMSAFVLPGLVGPAAVRVDYVLVGLLIGLGNLFFLSVLEAWALPSWLRRVGTGVAIAGITLGIAAAADRLLPAALTDRWLNYAVLASAGVVFAGTAYAIRRGSRIIWFYLAGWAPVVGVFLLRLARNLGFLPQNDLVDMGTFAALAFESVALSLAIADRFRLLHRERDTAERMRAAAAVESETLLRAANTDFLTGLGNRTSFQLALRRKLDAAAPFTLYLIDLDHLKDVNDRLGHDGGDALLAHVAAIVRHAVGTDQQVARIGGDEFGLLVAADATAAADAALEALQGQPWSHGGRSWAISLSIGSAAFPADADDADALYKNADLALYQAKQRGRGRQCRYEPAMRAAIDRRAIFTRDAHIGLGRGEFVLHYQPIVDLHTGRASSVEALLRWHHPVHGLLTPSIFGEILADPAIGSAIQDLVLTDVLHQLGATPAVVPMIAINATAAQLDGPHAARRLLTRLAKAGVAPGRLCVEVTEGIVLGRSVGQVVEALELLQDAGVQISLDDFGTGYASLIHLKQMPIDILKIDRSFVLSLLDDDGKSEAIIRAIIGLGQGLRKTVIAEGIETDAQRIRLISLGCRLGQGYLFSKPVADITGVSELRLQA